jgi:urea transport system ATP-binding protein
MSTPAPLLAIEDVTLNYDGFLALKNLTLNVAPGELRFVIGPNGAGKTSLLDVITGKARPTRGRVTFDGQDLIRRSPQDIAALGIGRKFQTPAVFPGHSVFDNMVLSLRSPRGVLATLIRPMRPTYREEIFEILEIMGLRGEAERPAGLLSHGQKQWLELAMLMTQEPRLLLLDEPAAGMTGLERDQTVRLLQTIAKDHTVLVIEHDMEFVRRLAQTVTVLQAGSVLCEGTMAEVQANPTVVEVYLGRSEEVA